MYMYSYVQISHMPISRAGGGPLRRPVTAGFPALSQSSSLPGGEFTLKWIKFSYNSNVRHVSFPVIALRSPISDS